MTDDLKQEKRERILDAALSKFSAYGFARTSMNDIAEAAEMSRPALYQHYRNKEEVFQAMLSRLLDDAADRAISSLSTEPDLTSQLDGFLQRWFGDLVEQVRSTEHGADLMEARNTHARPVVDAINARVIEAVSSHVGRVAPDKAGALADLLLLAPIGFKYDQPSVAAFRSRLTTLASSVADTAER